jgi:hypothetical protein
MSGLARVDEKRIGGNETLGNMLLICKYIRKAICIYGIRHFFQIGFIFLKTQGPIQKGGEGTKLFLESGYNFLVFVGNRGDCQGLGH